MSLWAVPWKCARLMSLCLSFNGFSLFDKLTDIMIENKHLHSLKWWHCREQLRSGRSSLNLALLLRFVFPGTQSRSNLLACWVHRHVCVHPYQIQRFHACISALLHRNDFAHNFRMYQLNLFTSRSQHKIFEKISTVDVIPELSSFFQNFIVLKRDFWYWACNFLNCIQLCVFFELFTCECSSK